MRRALIGGFAAGLLVIAGMIWLLATRQPPPEIPSDPVHQEARRASTCVECHGVDGPMPRTKNHPLNDRCFQCHLRPGL